METGTQATEGRADAGTPTVLFLCVHNAGRSQMALGSSITSPETGRSPGQADQSPATR